MKKIISFHINRILVEEKVFLCQNYCDGSSNRILNLSCIILDATSSNKENNDNELQINSQTLLATTPVSGESSKDYLIPTPQVTPTTPTLTHTASSSCLVDYFCSVSECGIGEQLPNLDIISLLVNSESQSINGENSSSANTTEATIGNEDESNTQKRSQFYFKKTREIKLEKENLFAFNNQPVQIDETFAFDLNTKTAFLNIFLWTIQYTNKMTKMKNLLVGYISLPLNDINVDCWTTNKGETQSTIYFKPVEELKASAISKLTKSHVISDHPGFDANISIGSLTVNFVHKLNMNGSIQQSENSKKSLNLASKIADELVEQNLVEAELNKQIANSTLMSNEVDDGSIHKFINVQFNDTVICEFCNKKVVLKYSYLKFKRKENNICSRCIPENHATTRNYAYFYA